jgi:hypothetical protein
MCYCFASQSVKSFKKCTLLSEIFLQGQTIEKLATCGNRMALCIVVDKNLFCQIESVEQP